jgi:hypothetical protein
MRFVRERKFLLAMAVALVFSAVMAVRQVIANQSRHAELREAFILLQSKGHVAEAQELYTRLIFGLHDEPTRHLIEDIQRTSAIAPPNEAPTTNIVVRYHLSVKKELEKRLEAEYLKARNLSKTGP